jgi:NDP-sugar pyrophosphorylase family protein
MVLALCQELEKILILWKSKLMAKKRLTITLEETILKRVDSFIDGEKIRNRSHAIEFLLSQAFQRRLNQAVILAAGKGVRWKPLTNELPKALIPLKGRPILEHTILYLKKFGINQIYLVIGHLGEKIREYFGGGESWGVNIVYIEDKKQKGTAPALKAVEAVIRKETFLVWYVDEIAEIDLFDFAEFHKKHKATVTLALSSVADPKDLGIVKLQGTRIKEFIEKPQKKVSSYIVNAGIFIAEPEIFKYIKNSTKSLEKEVFPILAKENKLFGYLFAGKWFDIGTPRGYTKVLKEW